MGNLESFNPQEIEETYGLVPKLGSAEISGAPMESPDALSGLEAVDELTGMLESIEDEKRKKRIEEIFKGLIRGSSDKEILDELGKVEGERITPARLRRVFRDFIIDYVPHKTTNMPATLAELRRLVEHGTRNMAWIRAEKRREYLELLSDEAIRLAGEKQTEQIKQEEAVIEYLLGGGSEKSLADVGLRTKVEISAVKKRVTNRLDIPADFLRLQIEELAVSPKSKPS